MDDELNKIIIDKLAIDLKHNISNKNTSFEIKIKLNDLDNDIKYKNGKLYLIILSNIKTIYKELNENFIEYIEESNVIINRRCIDSIYEEFNYMIDVAPVTGKTKLNDDFIGITEGVNDKDYIDDFIFKIKYNCFYINDFLEDDPCKKHYPEILDDIREFFIPVIEKNIKNNILDIIIKDKYIDEFNNKYSKAKCFRGNRSNAFYYSLIDSLAFRPKSSRLVEEKLNKNIIYASLTRKKIDDIYDIDLEPLKPYRLIMFFEDKEENNG